MDRKPTYEELERRIEELERESADRTLAAEALRERYSMVEDILQKAADGICVCHNVPEEPHTLFTHWNPRMTEITGYTLEEINRLGWSQTMYPDPEVQARAIARGDRMRAGDDIKREEWVICTKGGKKRTLSISTSVVKKEDEKIHVLAMMKDVTEQKLAEEALLKSEEQYRLIAEHTADVLYRVRLEDERYTYASPSVEKILGYTLGEVCSLRVRDVLTAESYERQRNGMLEALTKGKMDPEMMELEAVHKDGHTIPVEIHAGFVFDEQGVPVGIQGTARDITERKQAYEQVRRAHEELEKRVEERTLELRRAKDDLETQKNKLEEMNIALRVLLEKRGEEKAGVEETVHFNIRQLVLPYLEKLKQTSLDDRQAVIAEILESSLGEVVSSFSRRLSSNQLSLTPGEIKVAELIRQGKTSKEIADLIGVSPRTIEAHRVNIRKKIGIRNKKSNLRTHLMSME